MQTTRVVQISVRINLVGVVIQFQGLGRYRTKIMIMNLLWLFGFVYPFGHSVLFRAWWGGLLVVFLDTIDAAGFGWQISPHIISDEFLKH